MISTSSAQYFAKSISFVNVIVEPDSTLATRSAKLSARTNIPLTINAGFSVTMPSGLKLKFPFVIGVVFNAL